MKKTIEQLNAQQCYYCDKYFSNISKFHAHVKCCSEIAYKFEPRNIISFQDNFSYLGDLSFVVYFDYKMITIDSIFNDKKIFVLTYSQIYAFHPDLNLDIIVIFCSFQQKRDEIYSLNHFSEQHVKYFNKATFKQLKDLVTSVLNRRKSASLNVFDRT